MKKMKKLLSVLLASAMTLAMAAPAMAAPELSGSGSITITNATVGKEYKAYKIFDASPSDQDSDLIAYTATEGVVSELGNPNDYFEFTKNLKGTYNVILTSTDHTAMTNYLKSFFVDENDSLRENVSSAFELAGSDTATSAEVVFNNLPYGYYLVTSSLGSAVSIDSTNIDIKILDKNQQGPSWEDDDEHPDHGKKIKITGEDGDTYETSSTAHYGETVDFQIKFSTTNYNGEDPITDYYVYDELVNGMSYENLESTLTVMVGTEPITDFSFVESETTDKKFKIQIPWGTMTGETYSANYVSPNEITVTYSAKVDNNAIIAGDGNVNRADFSYKVAGATGETEIENNTRETTTYVYALGINKINNSGVVLSGAKFNVTAAGSTTPIKFNATEVDGVYEYAENGTIEEVVSPESGLIVLKGVAAGTYTLTETAAPAGYNKLGKPVTVEAVKAGSYTTTYTDYYKKNDQTGEYELVNTAEGAVTSTMDAGTTAIAHVSVINVAGSLLPSTGGIGTTIFYAAGIILMAGAVFFVVRRRRA